MPVKELAGAGKPVAAFALVPSMPGHVVAGSGDGKARLWNADAGSVVREVDHGGAIVAVAVRADGSRLATAGSIPGVKLWNLADGKLVFESKPDVRLARRLAAADLGLAVDKQDVEFGKTRVTAAEKDVTDAAEEKKKTAEAVAAAEKTLGEKTQVVATAEKAKGEADGAVAAEPSPAVAGDPREPVPEATAPDEGVDAGAAAAAGRRVGAGEGLASSSASTVVAMRSDASAAASGADARTPKGRRAWAFAASRTVVVPFTWWGLSGAPFE